MLNSKGFAQQWRSPFVDVRIIDEFFNLVPRASYLFDVGKIFYRYLDIKRVRCPGNEVDEIFKQLS